MTLAHLSHMLLAHVAWTIGCGHKGQRLMPNERDPQTDTSHPMIYQIRIKGHVGRQWTDWFGGLSISLEDDGDTLLTVPVLDQAALYGLLRTVRDIDLPWLSVIHVEAEPADALFKLATPENEKNNE
jgi:hypothetical protein